MTIFIDGYLWRIFSASVSPSMYGIRISVRTTSGSKASIFSNASSPFSASPTTVNPTACQSILRIMLLRTSSSSSTRIILYKSISCSYLLKDLFQMLPDDRRFPILTACQTRSAEKEHNGSKDYRAPAPSCLFLSIQRNKVLHVFHPFHLPGHLACFRAFLFAYIFASARAFVSEMLSCSSIRALPYEAPGSICSDFFCFSMIQ